MDSSIDHIRDALERANLRDTQLGEHRDRTEVLEHEQKTETSQVEPFRFLDLPSEIRLRIYTFVLFTPRRSKKVRTTGSVGASSKNKPLAPASHRLSLFLVSRLLHDEATHHFYSVQTFRLFPIQDYSRLPTVRALPPRYRPSITTIELILGSSWTAPPRSWAVDSSLGLEDMASARTLKVFIQCDPSHPVFEGFRVSKNYYTRFAGELMDQILTRLPNLVQVEFDGYPSVQRKGPLMSRLLGETKTAGKKVLWGPERGWSDLSDEEEEIAAKYESEMEHQVRCAQDAQDGAAPPQTTPLMAS